MKKIAIVLSAAAMLVGAGLSAQTARTFNGEIMDSNCAKNGAHHEGMAAKACTDACVKGGGSYVLYDAATKRTFMLDDQKKPAAFSGQKVTVTGTYNRDTKTIAVTDIKAAS
jgi:hypothetical protein